MLEIDASLGKLPHSCGFEMFRVGVPSEHGDTFFCLGGQDRRVNLMKL